MSHKLDCLVAEKVMKWHVVPAKAADPTMTPEKIAEYMITRSIPMGPAQDAISAFIAKHNTFGGQAVHLEAFTDWAREIGVESAQYRLKIATESRIMNPYGVPDWSPSSDWTDMSYVVMKVSGKDDRNFNLGKRSYPKGEWCASFHWCDGSGREPIYGRHPTSAGTAVCLAALRWEGVPESEIEEAMR